MHDAGVYNPPIWPSPRDCIEIPTSRRESSLETIAAVVNPEKLPHVPTAARLWPNCDSAGRQGSCARQDVYLFAG